MTNLEVIEKLCQIIQLMLPLIRDEAAKEEIEAAFKEAMGEWKI